jgi:hypothetical protein
MVYSMRAQSLDPGGIRGPKQQTGDVLLLIVCAERGREVSWIDSAREIVKRRTACRIDCETGHLVPNGRNRRGKVVLLDMFSASIMVQIHDALNPENQARFANLHVLRAHDIALKLAKN